MLALCLTLALESFGYAMSTSTLSIAWLRAWLVIQGLLLMAFSVRQTARFVGQDRRAGKSELRYILNLWMVLAGVAVAAVAIWASLSDVRAQTPVHVFGLLGLFILLDALFIVLDAIDRFVGAKRRHEKEEKSEAV
jgi:hypothetical protein